MFDEDLSAKLLLYSYKKHENWTLFLLAKLRSEKIIYCIKHWVCFCVGRLNNLALLLLLLLMVANIRLPVWLSEVLYCRDLLHTMLPRWEEQKRHRTSALFSAPLLMETPAFILIFIPPICCCPSFVSIARRHSPLSSSSALHLNTSSPPLSAATHTHARTHTHFASLTFSNFSVASSRSLTHVAQPNPALTSIPWCNGSCDAGGKREK